MVGSCCNSSCSSPPPDDKVWRRVLWIALAVNLGMFGVELFAGIAAQSASLKADALDFLGDAANYAISLGVAGLALKWRARAALLKGASLVLLGLWIVGTTLNAVLHGSAPEAQTMGIIGVLALLANAGVAILLFRFREGDANRRSVWICSRNDAIGNVAVVLAAVGVFGTGTAWPDLIVAGIMSSLSVWGGLQIMRQANSELTPERNNITKSTYP